VGNSSGESPRGRYHHNIMASPTPTRMLELARRLATQAAEIALRDVGKPAIRYKPDKSVVTETDSAIQAMILDALADIYPDHAVIAEEVVTQSERHADRRDARFCWVIDPLDGTRNYVAGIPCFCTSIAVLDRGMPVVGVVAEHNVGNVYHATATGGAFLDDRPISASRSISGRDQLVGIPSDKSPLTVAVLGKWITVPGLVTRNFGSIALHLAMVASGALDAALSVKGRIWDIAAGALIITEAGGCHTDVRNQSPFPFGPGACPDDPLPVLAGCPDMHEKLLGSINEATRGDA